MVSVKSKELKETFICFSLGYCEMAKFLSRKGSFFANYGVYGWNYSVYLFGNICVTSGYRGMIGERVPSEIVDKYNQRAERVNTYDEFDAMYKSFESDLRDYAIEQHRKKKGIQ